MGKPSGTDERLGKRTYVSVFGLERARELAASSHERRARGARRGARACSPATPRDLELMTDFMYATERLMAPKRRTTSPTRLLDRVDGPAGPEGARRRRAPAARAGGARVHHRHGRRDRRPLRRQPRHLRAGGRAAQPARLAARQDPLGRRPPGLPAQGPDRPPRRAADDPPVRRPGAVLLPRGVRARHHGRRPRLDRGELRGRHQGGDAQAARARDRRRTSTRRAASWRSSATAR